MYEPHTARTHTHIHTRDLAAHTDTHAIYLLDTSSVPSVCMQSFTAAQQIVAELLQYAVRLGERGGGGGLGSGSRLSEDVRSAEPGATQLSWLSAAQ